MAAASRPAAIATAVLVLGGIGVGCAGRRFQQDLPPQTVTAAAPEGGGASPIEPAAEAAPPTVSATPPGATPTGQTATDTPVPARAPTTIVVEEGGGALRPGGLAEASRAERQRRSQAGEPVAVITPKNLKDYATGRVTTGPAAAPRTAAESGARDEAARETYWRERLLALRRDWRRIHDSVPDREREAESLRVRFYATDDPYVRDAQIKPAWDHALEELRRSRLETDRLRGAVAAAIEEGRVAGAMPAWLREGAELEPPPRAESAAARERPALGEPARGAEPGEPDVIDEPPGR